MSRSRARRLGIAVSTVLLAALTLYPLLVYYGLRHFGTGTIAVALILICALRLLVARLLHTGRSESKTRPGERMAVAAGVGGILLAGFSTLQDSPDAMLYYPVLINAGMLLMFAYSLIYPPTIVERIARLKEGVLPDHAVAYTRRVTIAWIVFFSCNGAAALYTATAASIETWALYNGVVAYVLIGAMLGGELLTRCWVMRSAVR